MKIINKIIYVVTLATIIALGYLITKLNIWPNKYYIPIMILLIIWTVLLFFIGVKSKKKVLNIIAVILMVISIGINLFGSYYLYNTNRLFSSISEAVEKKVYYVIVGEFSEYNNLPDNVLDEKSQFFIPVNLEDSEKNIYIESYDNDDNFGAD